MSARRAQSFTETHPAAFKNGCDSMWEEPQEIVIQTILNLGLTQRFCIAMHIIVSPQRLPVRPIKTKRHRDIGPLECRKQRRFSGMPAVAACVKARAGQNRQMMVDRGHGPGQRLVEVKHCLLKKGYKAARAGCLGCL